MINAGNPQTPEEAFVTSIIMQAYRDLFVSIRNESNASFTTQSDQDQAIHWPTVLCLQTMRGASYNLCAEPRTRHQCQNGRQVA
jgi:hypothetical protein